MLRAFFKFSLLTLGVDAKGNTCIGNLTSGQPMALQDTPAQTDMPAGTETLDGGTHLTTAELKADHFIGSTQVAIDH